MGTHTSSISLVSQSGGGLLFVCLFFTMERGFRSLRNDRRKFHDPLGYDRSGEAPSVASRGEHGHHPVITQPVNRFCTDRIEMNTTKPTATPPEPCFYIYYFTLFSRQKTRSWEINQYEKFLDKAEDIAQNHFCVVFPSFLGRADSLGMGERRDTRGAHMWRMRSARNSLNGLLNLPRDIFFFLALVFCFFFLFSRRGPRGGLIWHLIISDVFTKPSTL